MKIAIEGCAHGELDAIYETIEYLEQKNNIKVNFLIICGDFQAVRNKSDLVCMAVPQKYRNLNTFYKYYSGEKKAPILTIFVGGNHEASNYMSELAYGGWVCENIYYMGYASVIEVGGLRIAGLSGIYKGQDYFKGHFEILPYDESTKRSIYHVRNIDVFRLKQLVKPIDIFVSHDWPRGIQEFGNKKRLLRDKPFFKDDIDSGKLGSRPSEELLFKLRPSYWFAAHLHCLFSALVPHEVDGNKTFTKFLSLDKCLPKRRFLRIVDIDSDDQSPLEIKYDPEWLSILKSTNHLLNVTTTQSYMPGRGCSDRWDFSTSEDDLANIRELFKNDLTIPKNFVHTAAPHDNESTTLSMKPELHINPQTKTFCEKLGIDDPLQLLMSGLEKDVKEYSFTEDLNVTDVSEISFDPDQTIEDDSEFSCFFIDKKGDRDGSFLSSSAQTSSPIAQKQLPKISFDFPEYKEEGATNVETVADNADCPLPFKIKRRNQSLYSVNDNEDDDN